MARTRQKVTGAIIVICNLPVFLSVTASPCRQKKLACTPSSSYKHTAAHEKMSWTNDRFFWEWEEEKKKPFTTTTTGGEIFSTSMVHLPHRVGKNPPGVWAYQKARCPVQTSNFAKSLFVFKNWGNTTVYLKKLAPSCFDVDMQLFRAGC